MSFNREQFSQYVKQIEHCKSLPDAKYVHRESLLIQNPSLFEFISAVAKALKVENDTWNIVKLSRAEFKLSLLCYPNFFTDSYPSLKKSISVDLTKLTSKIISYADSTNPPILHRKELFILPSNNNYQLFCEITQEGEAAGLYENPHKIGFKETWERLIAQKGYFLVDGRLERSSSVITNSEQDKIDRHRTAIARYELSTPFKCLAKHGYLDGSYSIFDYGCGRGDDLRELEAHGLDASGWDPNFRPDADYLSAEIVNIGFVINVIEDIDERIEAIHKAHSLSKKILVVSAMIAGEATISKFKPYKDGILTSRNTFQKYYSQAELQSFIERTLDDDAIAVSPGIFYVFKDKLEEQQFLSQRQKRKQNWNHLTSGDQRKSASSELLFIKHKDLLDEFWFKCLELGRLPANDEFHKSNELREHLGSHQKAFRILRDQADISDYEKAKQMRKDDLLVYFSLGLFGKRKAYKEMPESLKRDIKAFFDKYQHAKDEARELLFSVADPNLIQQLCIEAIKHLPAYHFNQHHSLILHEKFVATLPAALRVYIGCAAQLFGDLENIDLIKIHIRSGKVSFMNYKEFDTSPLPLLEERIKVKLRDQDVDFFDYVDRYIPPPLYWKSKYIDESFDDFKKQSSFDSKLASFAFIDISKEFGPSRNELDTLLRDQGKKIKGYRFYNL